jgi:hypothetical protein
MRRLWRWVIEPFVRRRGYVAIEVEEVPDRLRPCVVYIVGAPGRPWCATFLCPCGCKELIQLSLIPEDQPSWSTATDRGGRITIRPSIDRVRGCRSHFFVWRGRIEWVPSERRTFGDRPSPRSSAS